MDDWDDDEGGGLYDDEDVAYLWSQVRSFAACGSGMPPDAQHQQRGRETPPRAHDRVAAQGFSVDEIFGMDVADMMWMRGAALDDEPGAKPGGCGVCCSPQHSKLPLQCSNQTSPIPLVNLRSVL